MSDTGDDYRAMKAFKAEERAHLGIDCPGCIKFHPKRNPTRLMPGRRCKVCGYQDCRLEVCLVDEA
jgi:rRNA maturation endonuclease Nob1